jgi:hypothetical protein
MNNDQNTLRLVLMSKTSTRGEYTRMAKSRNVQTPKPKLPISPVPEYPIDSSVAVAFVHIRYE